MNETKRSVNYTKHVTRLPDGLIRNSSLITTVTPSREPTLLFPMPYYNMQFSGNSTPVQYNGN